MKFRDIPQFTRDGNYEVNIPLDYLEGHVQRFIENHGLILESDFQRGHVWNKKQRIAFVEYFLKGGKSGRVLYFNHPMWMDFATNPNGYNEMVIVDGLQRLTALRMFANNKLKAFGQLCSEFEEPLRMCPASDNLRFNVNSLKTKQEVLKWYLEMNSGGTPHTKAELNKVRDMLDN